MEVSDGIHPRRHLFNRISMKEELLRNSILDLLRRLISRIRKCDAARHSEAEEKVYSWIYRIAQADKDMAFEYVRSTERGLSFKEAERRLKENGPNLPFDHTSANWWQLLGNGFMHPFNIILFIVAILSLLAGDYGNGSIMLTLIFISVGIQFHQEYSSSRAAMKLFEMLKSPVKVQRCAGRIFQTELIVQVDQREIVPGDIINFTSEDLFPGDVRLLTAKDLVVNQSSLTGESRTMEKTSDVNEHLSTPLLELRNICFMGTTIISGSGTGLVISTGSKTYVNTIFSTLEKVKPLDAFAKGIRCISYALICMMIAIIPLAVLSDFYASYNWSERTLFGISVAVALTPQMLPLIVNTNLAKGAIAMAREKCIVKSLVSIQNMGAMDILCIDKTGTLTMDRAIMVHHLDSWGLPREKILKFAFLNSYFKTTLKSPIDDAILAHVYTSGYRFEPSKWTKVDEVPFDFTRKKASVIVGTNINICKKNGSHHKVERFVITKGALVEVLKSCSFIDQDHNGEILPLTLEDYQRVLQMGEKLSSDGFQVLGLAIRRISKETCGGMATNGENVEWRMVFLGILSFFDPPKDSAKQALQRIEKKGVSTKVLTGDSLTLAIKVCKDVGIMTTHVITGPDLEHLNHDEFHDTIKKATVLARLTPIQKLHVIQSLQRDGNHVVGYLGDGINDSLALDAADVGISVDSGASVAKELADIILLEKDLNVLVSGVECGRITYVNTMKYIKMSLIANLGSTISLLLAVMFLQFEPLSPRQLLTQNFLYNVGQIAIPWDKMEEEYAKLPQRWSSKGLPLFMLWNGPICSVFDTANFLFLWFYYGANRPSESRFFQSAWFVEGLLMQTLIIHMIRTEKIPFVQDMASGPVLSSTIVVSTAGIAITFTPIGKFLGLTHLPPLYYGFLVILFLGYFIVGHVVKRAYIMVFKKWL
uniref:Magnesium-transporting ATPase, P-type 1 n=1 Tax=Anthurium amnicola TaxID=1678845 RepID=A0A1D1XQ30_9ARAE